VGVAVKKSSAAVFGVVLFLSRVVLFDPCLLWFCVYVSAPHSRAAHSLPLACSLAFASSQQIVVF
jgi:hypothetical protein